MSKGVMAAISFALTAFLPAQLYSVLHSCVTVCVFLDGAQGSRKLVQALVAVRPAGRCLAAPIKGAPVP